MTEEQILEIVAFALELPAERISKESNLESLGWDSLVQLAFIAELDARFGVQTNAQALSEARDLQDIYVLLTK